MVRGDPWAARAGGSERHQEFSKPYSSSKPKCEVCQEEGLSHTRLSTPCASPLGSPVPYSLGPRQLLPFLTGFLDTEDLRTGGPDQFVHEPPVGQGLGLEAEAQGHGVYCWT